MSYTKKGKLNQAKPVQQHFEWLMRRHCLLLSQTKLLVLDIDSQEGSHISLNYYNNASLRDCKIPKFFTFISYAERYFEK